MVTDPINGYQYYDNAEHLLITHFARRQFEEELFRQMVGMKRKIQVVQEMPPGLVMMEQLIIQPHCGVEKLVSHKSHNLEYVGSSPIPATIEALLFRTTRMDLADEPADSENTSSLIWPVDVNEYEYNEELEM